MELIVPEHFSPHVTAFFTGKEPGGDPARVAAQLNISPLDIYLPIQKHTDEIQILESSRERRVADAVITNMRGVLIGVQVADCVPVLLCAPRVGAIAAVHAGWRGTAHGILKKTILTMVERFKCRDDEMLAAVGPSIRGCCYEVDREVADAVRVATGPGDYVQETGAKCLVDLGRANVLQAASAGIPDAQIKFFPDCTFCKPERYYSYRYSKGSTGRQGAFIGYLSAAE